VLVCLCGFCLMVHRLISMAMDGWVCMWVYDIGKELR
jgi:hypothetical protein